MPKKKLDVSISGRVSEDTCRELDSWLDRIWRKRSEAVGLIVERVLNLVRESGRPDLALECVVRSLRLEIC